MVDLMPLDTPWEYETYARSKSNPKLGKKRLRDHSRQGIQERKCARSGKSVSRREMPTALKNTHQPSKCA